MAVDKTPSVEESFRASLQDVVTVVEALSTHVEYMEDLVSVVRLALDSEAQLRLLMSLVKTSQQAQPTKR